MEAIGTLRKNGIYFDLVQIKKSPWEGYSDEAIEKLLFFGEWENLSLELKLKWLDSIRKLHFSYLYKGSWSLTDTATYELDGRKIVDYPSFFIALGEAINGFGGYFGSCLYGLDDCLDGGFGAPKLFIIKWYHSEESRKNLEKSSYLRVIRAIEKEEDFNGEIDERTEDDFSNLFYEFKEILGDRVEML